MQRETTSLSEKRHEMTRGLILDAAFALLRDAAVGELTVRSVAQQANISERTVFRYFPARDALLDAVAHYLVAGMAAPPPPDSLDSLLAAPRRFYEAFEVRADFTRAALHPDLVKRIRSLNANARWDAVVRLLDASGSSAGAAERRIAAANICYHLTASSWHYYRSTFGFDLEESIACAETAVRQALRDVVDAGRRAT